MMVLEGGVATEKSSVFILDLNKPRVDAILADMCNVKNLTAHQSLKKLNQR